MNLTQKIVGVHLLIMFVYVVGIGMFDRGVFQEAMLILPFHVGLCSIAAFIFYIFSMFSKSDRNKMIMHAQANFLSALAVAVIGFSSCTFMFFAG